MSEQVPQDVPSPGTPIRDLTPEPLLQDQDPRQQHEDQESQELLQSEDADGGLSTTDDDDHRKMSQDSLISASPRGSPLPHPAARRCYQDSDSCPSVSPSPDPDSRLQTFEYSMVEAPVEGEAISAALQTEREFLDFMLSLPQIQKEGPGRPLQTHKERPGQLPHVQKEGIDPKEGAGQPSQEALLPLRSEQRSPTRAPATVGGVVGTKMGLDHLDNLCRMMEQLGELREQNTRLQRRVHYLEELQTLQEMHRHLQETLEARRSGLGLGPIHLSDSDLHIDDDGDGGGGELSRHGSEESLLLLTHRPPHKGKSRATLTMARSRSKSVGTDLLDTDTQPVPKTKVSGWKRVREALKWERATFLPPAPTPATATSAHHPTSPQPTPSPQPTTHQDPFFRPASSSSSSSVLTEVTEEELLNLYRQEFDKDQFLEPPESPGRRHSSSEDDRRPPTLDPDVRAPPHDKEKKGHRSAWGKVKNMISTRRDSVRKKSSSALHRKSTVERPCHDLHAGVAVEVSAASDPEDYEVEDEGLVGEAVDPGGSVGLCLEGSEGEWDAGGVWTGPREDDMPVSATSLGLRRAKPQLTITVPSSENLTPRQGGVERPRQPHRSPEACHRKISTQLDPRVPASLPMTPPSPRRASNWTKVKKAFLTGQQQHHPIKAEVHAVGPGDSASLPPSPSKKTAFHFDAPPPHLAVDSSALYDFDSPMATLEVSSDDLVSQAHSTPTPSPQPHSTPSPQPHTTHQQHSGVQRNLADLQKSLSGEFSRRLQEWEKLRSGVSQGSLHPMLAASGSASVPTAGVLTSHPEDNLPYEFRKKLHEWEKMKEREKEKGKVEVPRGQEDVKTKKHGEDDLPADFRKKLTEWEIRKALAGKSQQNVEELQKNLGEEFNRKMAEWERIKASANQGNIKPTPGHLQVKSSASAGNIQVKSLASAGQMHLKSGSVSNQGQVKTSASASQVLVKPLTGGPGSSPRLDRKGSAHKIKKIKASKTDKAPLGKADGGHKGRDKSDKELQWLEKELHKVERETQRLEREKEKFLERQARLEKMRQAMGQGGPAKKKEIYIKTSTGEFRFEGISQTFTKKLYEWEERRGIRPESSTIALLDPNYKAPEKEVQEKPKSPELVRLVRSKSESSMVADLVPTSVHSHPSSHSLNEMDTDDPGLQAENKAASEPTLAADDPITPKVAVLVQLEEVVDDSPSLHDPATPYAPAEITRNIDSSGSEEDVTRRRRADDDEDVVTNLRRSDSSRTQGSYRSLLHENMSLLDKLRQQEDLCRALETQMGDIDSKMDNVADQHLRTLEKLHRQVTIMKDSSSTPLEGGDPSMAADDAEANQRLINQLRARIVELEMRGDHLMEEKEQLERAFKLHKEHETEIAESLVQRIRELQDAGAEVNIQTVQCQSHDLSVPPEDGVAGEEHLPEDIHEEQEAKEEAGKSTPEGLEQEEPKKEVLEIIEKEEVKVERREGRTREHRKVKKAPPKKVQKLHNLTADLLLQAKRLEQALVAKHGLNRRPDIRGGGATHGTSSYRQRSLRGRSSLRLVGDVTSPQRRCRATPARTWSSIEAITVPGDSHHESGSWDGAVGVGQEVASTAPTEAGTLVLSRSFRGPSAYSSYSCDPQDLLAMNAELSRMAKELRTEMMKMWSFRDSTSPESETSEPISARDLEETKAGTDQLVTEANEVFQSIALLQKDGSPPSPHAGRSPSTRSQRSPSATSLSKRRESAGLEEKRNRRSTEDRDRRSANSTPSRRDSYRQQQQQQLEEEEEQHQKETDISVFLPGGATLGELLMRTQQHYEEEEEEERTWEGPRRRSSDGLSTVTSGPSRSHSPSPSIASSAPEAESSPRLDEDEDSISLAGTWKTTTTSTTRSGEHMLSSSFEWESEDTEERKKPRGRWKAVVEEEDEEIEDFKKPKGRWQAVVEEDEDETEEQKAKERWQGSVEDEEDVTEEHKKLQGRWHIVVEEKEEDTEEQKQPKGKWQVVMDEKQEEPEKPNKIKGKWQAVVEEEDDKGEEEKEEGGAAEEQKKPKGRWQAVVEEGDEIKEPKKGKCRWQAVVEEEAEETDKRKRTKGRWQAVVEEEKEDSETPKPHMLSQEVKDASKSFETEVTVSLTGLRQAGRDLRMRRISDTQVEYESFGQNNRDECFANTFSRTVYDDEALTAGRLSRNPSIRTAASRDADDSSWRRVRALPSMMTGDPLHSDRSPDVFVPTKRTIFTVQGGMSNPEHARATPTFVDSQEDDQEVGVAPWHRSHSRPTTPAETCSTPTTPLQDRKDHCLDDSGILEVNVPKAVKKDRNKIKSESGTLTKYPQTLSIDIPESVVEINQSDNLTKQTQMEVTNLDLKSDEGAVSSYEENEELSNTIPKEETPTQDDKVEVLTPTSEALEVVLSLPDGNQHYSSHQQVQTQFPTSIAITSSMLQMPPCTTPPIESKKKVLEAANEGVPTVRNIIQKFNQRITENQELLGSPFRSPPNSPPWQSPRTQRKILAGLMAGHDKENTDVSQSDVMPTLSLSPHSLNLDTNGGVLKSLSASVIVSNSEVPQQVQRSASGPLVQDKSSTNNVHATTSTGLLSPQTSKFKDPASDVWSVSPPVTPAISPVPTDADTSCDMDLSVEDTGQLLHDRMVASPQPESRSPTSHLRALRIKKAKEEFLARGAAPLTTEQRFSGCHDSVKLRHRSGTTSTEDSWRESDEICAGGSSHLPSPTPTEESAQDREEILYKPPRVTSRRRNIPKKESFRRQSAGCLLEESASQLLSSQVIKSSSSGVLGSGKRHSRYSVESESPDRRKASVDPSVDSSKSPLGIFKLFRRSKNKDKKDMPSVQRLCRQSLLVDFANGKGRTKSASPQPYLDSQLHALPEVDSEDAPESARSSTTLPRGGSGETAPPAPSRSCPSSPVARHRSRTANWLARGRQIFKSRSPSPGKKPR